MAGIDFFDRTRELTNREITEINSLNDIHTFNLQSLSIYNIAMKLKNPGKYDIGGCRQDSLDLWFFFTTSICPGDNYLLNIFVCNLKPSFVSLDICSKSTLEAEEFKPILSGEVDYILRTWNKLEAKEFGCRLSGEYERIFIIKNEGNSNHHLRTYRFSEEDIAFMDTHNSILKVPIKVNVCSESVVQDVHPSIRNRRKLGHNLGSLLETGNDYDFALESNTGKKIGVHSIVLMAHSTVFKELVMNTVERFLHIDADDIYLMCMIEFLYTGRLKDDTQGTYCNGELLSLAEKYRIGILSEYLRCIDSS